MKMKFMLAGLVFALLCGTSLSREAGKPVSTQANQDGAATARAMVATIADVAWLAG